MTNRNSNRSNIKNRYLEISKSSNKNNFVPFLKLQGKWLEQAGFMAGGCVEVVIQKGVLIISAYRVTRTTKITSITKVSD